MPHTTGNALRDKTMEIAVGRDAVLPKGFKVASVSYENAATGCTVVLCDEGAIAGAAITGAAPATRETDLLRPENIVERIHGLVLSGGSAFGLDAAGGVMRLLAERGVGLAFGKQVIPIVVGASLFDLDIGTTRAFPDDIMGYEAASRAVHTNEHVLETGNVGAGTGATVGKILGMNLCMKGGLGAASVTQGDLVVTALVAVNAFGCVYDRLTATLIAGVLDPQTVLAEEHSLLEPYRALEMLVASGMLEDEDVKTGMNTTIGCIVTNARLTKVQAHRVALMAHDGYARAIDPVHTSFDGDAIFCMSTAEVTSHPDILGPFAALTMERAVVNAIMDAQSAYGIIAACDLQYD